MGFFHERKGVDEYNKIAEGYDGRDLIAVLRRYLPAGSTVLELGMGPGKDLDLLAETYTVTGSDYSDIFLEDYRSKHPKADLLNLDAANMETDRKFDCVYSNKVLHHIERSALRGSFRRQSEILTGGGLAFHSFWHGDGEEEHQGLRFVYYTEQTLIDLVGPEFSVIETRRYTEMEADDSLYVLLRKES